MSKSTSYNPLFIVLLLGLAGSLIWVGYQDLSEDSKDSDLCARGWSWNAQIESCIPDETPDGCPEGWYEDVWGTCINPVVIQTTNGQPVTTTKDMTRIDIKFGLADDGIISGVPNILIIVLAIGLAVFIYQGGKKK